MMNDFNKTSKSAEGKKPEYQTLWAYIDNKRRRIGYAYKTKNDGLCIKGDKLLDKIQLGKLLRQGVYVFPSDDK